MGVSGVGVEKARSLLGRAFGSLGSQTKLTTGANPPTHRFAGPFTPLAARALSNGELIKGFELDNGHVFLDFNGGFPFRVFRLGL